MEKIMEVLAALVAKLGEFLKTVVPAEIVDGILGKIAMPIAD